MISNSWGFWIVLGLAAALLIWLRTGQLGSAQARQLIAGGARVIDVRTPGEFQADPVPGAVNIPLSEVAEQVPRQYPDRDAVLLLHCQSGGRSRIACGRLKKLGYTRVYNLGSAARARSIAGS